MTTPNPPQFRYAGAIDAPLQPGTLCNQRGSNTGVDSITMTARYSNPMATADPALAIRVTSQRTVTAGTPQTPTMTWDSGWVGGITVNALPVALQSHQAVFANGRIYVIGGQDASFNLHAEVWSASFNNGAIGTWRRELDYPIPVAAHAACTIAMNSASPDVKSYIWVIGGATAVNPLTPSYATPTGAGWYAPINADGSLGGWIPINAALPGPRMFGQLCQLGWMPWVYGGDNSGFGAPLIGFSGGSTVNSASAGTGVFCSSNPAADVFTQSIKADGQMYGTSWPQPGNMGTAVFGHYMCYDDLHGWIGVFGGSNGTAAQAIHQFGAWNPLSGAIGAITWGTTASGLPAARCGMAGVFVRNWDSSNDGRVILIGGHNGVGVPSGAGGGATQYSSSIFAATGTAISSTSWTTLTNALPATRDVPAAVGSMEARSGTVAGVHRIAVIGGENSSGTPLTTVVTAASVPPSLTSNYGVWSSGSGTALTAASLGTGSSLTFNQDGSQDFTFNYGAFGHPILSSFLDGDQAQVSVQFLGLATGDPSPIATTLIKIGQPPSVGSLSPSAGATVTNGQPPLSFLYSAGAGGGPEYNYRIQLSETGLGVVFDTGVRYDSLNAAVLDIAPLLPPSLSYSLTVSATSTDTAYNAASNVDTSVTVFFSLSAFAVAGTPTGLTATPNETDASVVLSWDTAAVSYWRIYYRRSGTSTWYMLEDNVSTNPYTAMDHIALGVAYDFAVSAVDSTPSESSMAIASNVTIPLGAWSAYLHVAGSTTGVPLQVNDSPQIARKMDVTSLSGFGQGAPITRYGTADYRTLSMTALLLDSTPASLKALQSIIAAVRAGGVCFYRDALGGMLVCTVDAEQDISILPPFYRQPVIKLTETLDTVGPYATAGSAQGYLTLTNGRRPPLDTSESLL